MIFHNDERCPVCDKLFNESDDIVICPHCATPHHRDCYNQLGHCANKDKHRDGFDYRVEQKKFSEQQSASDEKPQQNNGSEKAVCSSCGAEIDKSAPFCSDIRTVSKNAKLPGNYFSPYYLLREKRKFWQCFPKVFELIYCGAKSGLVLGAKKQETFS